MSNFRRLEYCTRCIQMTNHDWYDNTPKHHEYTVECAKCKLRTHESEWPRSSEQPASSELAQMPNQNSLEKLIDLYTIDVAYAARRQKVGNLHQEKELFLAAINKTIMEERVKVYKEVVDNLHHSNFKKYILELYNNDLKALRATKKYGRADNV